MKSIKILGLTIASILVFTACKKDVTKNTTEINQTKEKPSENTSEEKSETEETSEQIQINGEYSGVLPCADCPGIEITIKITDKGYEKTIKYKESKDDPKTTKGLFAWKKEPNQIAIEDDNYLIAKGKLTMLSKNGEVVEGELAEKYVLRKK